MILFSNYFHFFLKNICRNEILLRTSFSISARDTTNTNILSMLIILANCSLTYSLNHNRFIYLQFILTL